MFDFLSVHDQLVVWKIVKGEDGKCDRCKYVGERYKVELWNVVSIEPALEKIVNVCYKTLLRMPIIYDFVYSINEGLEDILKLEWDEHDLYAYIAEKRNNIIDKRCTINMSCKPQIYASPPAFETPHRREAYDKLNNITTPYLTKLKALHRFWVKKTSISADEAKTIEKEYPISKVSWMNDDKRFSELLGELDWLHDRYKTLLDSARAMMTTRRLSEYSWASHMLFYFSFIDKQAITNLLNIAQICGQFEVPSSPSKLYLVDVTFQLHMRDIPEMNDIMELVGSVNRYLTLIYTSDDSISLKCHHAKTMAMCITKLVRSCIYVANREPDKLASKCEKKINFIKDLCGKILNGKFELVN